MKNLRPFIPWIIIAALVMGAIGAFRQCRDNKKAADNFKEAIEIKVEPVEHRIDAQGRDHGTKQVQEATAAELRAINPFVDSVLQANKILRKQLRTLTAMSTRTTGTVQTILDTIYIEGAAIQHFNYADPYLKLEGIVTNPLTIKYGIYDSLIVTTYTRRKGFLNMGSRETYIDAYSLNPNAHISGLTGLRVATEKLGRFGVGPYVGYGFNGQQWQPSIGLAVQYSLIRF